LHKKVGYFLTSWLTISFSVISCTME